MGKGEERVSAAEVQKIAHLSRLSLEGKELEGLTKDFNQILDFVDKITEADTSGVEPLHHVLDLADVTRPDEPRQSLKPDEVKAIAPEFSAGYFVVPKVVDAES